MTQALQREFKFTPQDFDFIAELVRDKTGIQLADHKQDMVYSRIARRLRSLKLKTFADYCALLESKNGAEETRHFVNAMTTNLTSFFREAHHFVHLRDQVLKPLAANPPPGKRLRLWSAACSSGAEPYSIAMTCYEALGDVSRWDLKILATDIDTNMIAKSQSGEYSEADVEPIPAALRQKYTKPASGSAVHMHEALKRIITFKPLNLIEPWPFKGPLDVVFCRNVIIYFDKDTQRELFAQMAECMPIGGWLYIGHSETLHGISERFELQGKTIYRKVA